MGISDRRAIHYRDKRIITEAASWIEPTGGIVLFDDFLGDVIAGDTSIITNVGSGTTAISSTAGDPVAAHGGWIVQTVTADADSTELGFMAATTVGNFRADRAGNGMMVFQTRASSQEATTKWANCGFTDDETEGAAIAMSLSTATWTTTATDAALWGFYSTATDNDNWIGQTVDTNVDGTHVASAVAHAANTATVLRIEIDSLGICHFFQSDGALSLPAYQGTVGVGTSPDVPLIPYFGLAGTAAASATVEYDYVFAACAR